ncbi:MAG: pilus assembly protein TadB [Alphaproteobacteria bacterium]|nr:pilus assembly protein TadB [Alphaproteobacteria bacterium]
MPGIDSGSGFGIFEVAIMLGALMMAGVMVMAFYIATDGARRKQAQRLSGMRDRAMGTAVLIQQRGQASAVKRQTDTSLDALVRRFMPRPDQLRLRLLRTGRKITIGQYGAAIFGIATFTGLSCWYFFGFKPLLAGGIGLGTGLWLPHAVIGYLVKRRENQFTTRFPEGLDILVRGLRAGLPIAESIVNARSEVPEPVKTVYGQIADGVNLGQNLEEAIANAAKVLDTPELKFFSVSLSVQRETGGNLAETLANLAEILRRRRQMKMKVKAMSSEARASAYILGSLPFIMFGLIFFVNTDYAMELFTDPRGMVMVGVGVCMMLLGIGIMIKMVNFEI